jgi:hypothetical protein
MIMTASRGADSIASTIGRARSPRLLLPRYYTSSWAARKVVRRIRADRDATATRVEDTAGAHLTCHLQRIALEVLRSLARALTPQAVNHERAEVAGQVGIAKELRL